MTNNICEEADCRNIDLRENLNKKKPCAHARNLYYEDIIINH